MGIELSKKILAALMVVPVAITIFAIAAWQNWGGIGTALSNFGGPLGKGLVNLLSAPLNWALNGGGPTIAIFWAAGAAIVFGFAYWVWHWDIGYKISTGVAASNPSDNYDNSMQREPAIPETGPQNK